MDYMLLVGRLRDALRVRFPDEESHAGVLAELLGVSRSSVYLKLRGKRRFSLDELVEIAGAFSISLGRLLDDYDSVSGHPMELVLIENMSKLGGYGYAMDTTRTIFEEAGMAGYSRFTAVCRSMPVISCYYYEWLMKVAHLKWLYFGGGLREVPAFSELGDMEEFGDVRSVYVEAFQSIGHLVFVVDGDMIRNFLLDLAFFRKLGFVGGDDLQRVLDDVEALLCTVEDICSQGMRLESGQEIRVFYSEMPLYNDIYLVESSSANLGIFYAQGFNPIVHKERQTFDVMRSWVDGWIRSSNPICGIGDLDRRGFMGRQHAMVEEFRRGAMLPDGL